MIDELQKTIDEQPDREMQIGDTLGDIEKRLNEARAKLKAIYKEKMLIDADLSDSKSRTKAALYDEMEQELLESVETIEKQFGDLNAMRNTMIETNRKAKTVIEIFDAILQKEKLDKRDIGLLVERITVYEDHLDVKLKSDVDTLLNLKDEEHTINFNSDSKDISTVTSKSKNHLDKVFTVNIISGGDPLEIYTDREGEVIFKKYSPIGELVDFAADYAETLYKTCGVPVAVCDRDAVIACAGVPKKDFVDKKNSTGIEHVIEGRTLYVSDEGGERITVTDDDRTHYVYCAQPIFAEGDVIGCVASLAAVDVKKDARDAVTETKLIQTAASFLGRQLEM